MGPRKPGRPSEVADIILLPVAPGRRFASGDLVPLEDPHNNRASRKIAQAAHIRGATMPTPCQCCQSRRTRMFADCVTLQSYMKGRCTNCHWAQDGRLCVFSSSPLRKLATDRRRPIRNAPGKPAPSQDQLPFPQPTSDPPRSHEGSSTTRDSPSRPSRNEDPAERHPDIIQTATAQTPRSIRCMKQSVVMWVENDCGRDGLKDLDASLDNIGVDCGQNASFAGPFERAIDAIARNKGILVEMLGQLEELAVEKELYEERQQKIEAYGEKIEEKTREFVQRLKDMMVLHEKAIQSAAKDRGYIIRRGRYLKALYDAADEGLGQLSEGRNRRIADLELGLIPFNMLVHCDNFGTEEWKEPRRGPTIADEKEKHDNLRAEIIGRQRVPTTRPEALYVMREKRSGRAGRDSSIAEEGMVL